MESAHRHIASRLGSNDHTPPLATQMSIMKFVVASILLLSAPVLAAPQGEATRLVQTPKLDGIVAADAAWAVVTAMTGFTQVQPQEGAPASQRTEVFMGFTDDTLYLGFICHDDEPDQIIVSNSQRDSGLQDEDSVRFVIDSFRSEQSGFVFGTNPAGLEFDGQIVNTGANNFRNKGINSNWDTTWEVATQVGDFGWSAEFAIPFKSLRYAGEDVQTWNANFERTIRRNNETVYWAPIPMQYGLNRLTLAGSVQGIEAPAQRNLKITPYGLGKSSRGGSLAGSEDGGDVGFDIKYSVTPSLTLDLTYNTDFAQVEVDDQQVNLDRFSLFFREKRPFFLENAGIFEVGVPREVSLFFSRRIGIGPGGRQIPINAGVRLSGKVAGVNNLGFLYMQTDEVGGVAPRTDFTVARVSRELHNRSSIGALVVNRDDDLTDNQTYAVDGQWGVGENTTYTAFFSQTETEGVDEDDHAFHLSGAYNGEIWSYNVSYSQVGVGFNPEVGFLARRDYRRVSTRIGKRIRYGKDSSILQLRPHASYNSYWNFDGSHESSRLHLDQVIEWKNGAMMSMAVDFFHEGVLQAFEIIDGVVVPKDEFDHEEFRVFASTDQSAVLGFGLEARAGGFFGGNRVSAKPSVTYRIGETFNANLSVDHNDVDLPGGNFKVNLTQLKLSYFFTPKISLQGFVQHNDRHELLSTNLRFSWLRSANSGLYVVYNETDDNFNFPGRPRREFMIKYSHIFDIM